MTKNSFNTLIAEPEDYSQKAIALYRSLGSVYFLPDISKADKAKIFKDINIIVVRLAYKIDSAWLDAMPNLKVIATPTTGMNHLDLVEIKKRGIKIISLRGRTGFLKYITSTAEETMALLLALVRRLPWAFDDVKNGNWNRDAWKGHQFAGKVFGILGCGRLGKIVARYAKAFGMQVLAADPFVSAKAMQRLGIKKVDMNTLFKKSDIVSLHVLLTDGTYNLVKENHLKMMQPSAYLVNTARAEIIEKNALEEALEKKWLAGAAVDVMWDETGKSGEHLKSNRLLEYAKKNTNLIIVPHVGGATYEAMQITEDFIADLVKNFAAKI